MSLIRLIGLVAIAASIFGLTGCDKKTVTIKYSQRFNCGRFLTDPGNDKSKKWIADGGTTFMIYEIHSIENNEANAADFNFVLSKIFAGNKLQRPQQKTWPWPGLQPAPDNQVIHKGSIAPGWRFVIQVACDSSQQKSGTQDLSYENIKVQNAPVESVLMVNVPKDPKNPTATALEFLDPCYPGGVSKQP